AKVLHITGITLALSKTAREAVYKAVEIAKENGVLVSFDPNIRLKLWTAEEAKTVILNMIKMSDIVFPGIDEGKLLLGTEDPQEIVRQLLSMGCSTVAVKLGKEGCYIANKQEAKMVEGYVVERLVDTVGAGDGYAAGFLSGILKALTLEECGKLANAVGAMATLVRGDMEGFPTLSQVKEFMGTEAYIDR
ncbi:MAG: sugar kinase, partial [Clostridiaceae bacterium]|nr:sugar kinase [Clostridiaceae bacterium]